MDLAAAPDARKPTAKAPPASQESSFRGPFRRCPKCGADNPKGAKFCCACATDLLPPSVAPTPSAGAGSGIGSPPGNAASTPAAAQSHESSSSGRRICPGCHILNPAEAAYCAECGVLLPMDSTVPIFGRPAGFWIRALAGLIDAAILVAISVILAERLGLPDPDFDRIPIERALVESIPGVLLDLATAGLYTMLFVGTWGGTIGKLLLGLRIVRFSDGAKVPYGLALGRSFAELLSFLPLGLGYLWIGLNPSKRGWHDYLCDTRVVHAKPE